MEQEPDTAAWYGVQMGPTTFGIFDTFADETGRKAHLGDKVAEALFAQAPELFASAPAVEMLDILASKNA